MPVSRRALLGGVGIMGLSTFAAACEQGGRAVTSATSGTQLVDPESSGASAESTREGDREVSSTPKSADSETPDVAHDDDEHDHDEHHHDDTATDYAPDVVFRLRTGISGNRLVFLGEGGAIDGENNPDLVVKSGDVVQVTLINGDGAEHIFVIDEFDARSDHVLGVGASSTISFRADHDGEFFYYCSIPGHRAAGMEGRIAVGDVRVVSIAEGAA